MEALGGKVKWEQNHKFNFVRQQPTAYSKAEQDKKEYEQLMKALAGDKAKPDYFEHYYGINTGSLHQAALDSLRRGLITPDEVRLYVNTTT